MIKKRVSGKDVVGQILHKTMLGRYVGWGRGNQFSGLHLSDRITLGAESSIIYEIRCYGSLWPCRADITGMALLDKPTTFYVIQSLPIASWQGDTIHGLPLNHIPVRRRRQKVMEHFSELKKSFPKPQISQQNILIKHVRNL
jgi:hypothetical protein